MSFILNEYMFNVQKESTNNFLNELANKYGLHRDLLYVEGRTIGLCVVYDHNFIGTVSKDISDAGNVYFINSTFNPINCAGEICAMVNAKVEHEKRMERMSHNPLVVGEVFDINSIPESFLTHEKSQVK